MLEENEKCEGCGESAVCYDTEGVPLCKACAELPDAGDTPPTNNLTTKPERGISSELECSEWMDDSDDERRSVLGEEGCLYPDRCCMPGLHYTEECHTAEMLQAQEEESSIGALTDGRQAL